MSKGAQPEQRVRIATIETLRFLCLNERKAASSPFAQSFSHAKAQQQSDKLPRHDDALGSPGG